MSTFVHTHRSTAIVRPIDDRGRAWQPDPITNQFRFIVRMAYACHENGTPFVLTWGLANGILEANWPDWSLFYVADKTSRWFTAQQPGP